MFVYIEDALAVNSLADGGKWSDINSLIRLDEFLHKKGSEVIKFSF
jgi:hypothetical protein